MLAMSFISRPYRHYTSKAMSVTGSRPTDELLKILTLVLFIGISAKASFYSYTGYPV